MKETMRLARINTLNIHGKTKEYDKKAFYCLKIDNPVRFAMVWLVEWKFFEWFVIFCILGNSICLALFDYSDRDSLT